jgi:hypothetical protein
VVHLPVLYLSVKERRGRERRRGVERSILDSMSGSRSTEVEYIEGTVHRI